MIVTLARTRAMDINVDVSIITVRPFVVVLKFPALNEDLSDDSGEVNDKIHVWV